MDDAQLIDCGQEELYPEELQPAIIKQYPWKDVPQNIRAAPPPKLPIPPIKGKENPLWKPYHPATIEPDIAKLVYNRLRKELGRGPTASEFDAAYQEAVSIPSPDIRGPADYIKEETRKAAFDIPTRLTMDEYDKIWKPKGWNIIFIGPTKTWRSEWGVWEAVREIVQNALDETEAYEYGFDKMGFFIKDQGRGVGVRDFLLGPPKLKEDWSRGKYGEGMKIGALALVREGFPVYVEAGEREVIVCFLEQEAEGKVETLAALWKLGTPKVGTTWHIVNYRGDDFSDRFAVNLPESDILALTPSRVEKPVKRYNALIKGDPTQEGAKSRVFARDIYMRDINSPFSYNLWGFDLAPDRHAPQEENQFWEEVGRVWSCIKDPVLVETFLKMVSDPPQILADETRMVNMSYLGYANDGKYYSEIMKENAAVWKKAWVKVIGADAVMRTNERWDGTVKHLGYRSVSIAYGVRERLKDVVRTDQLLIAQSQEKLREVQVIKDSDLTPTQLASLNLARALVSYSTNWKVAGVHAAIIPPASDRVRTAGLYSRVTQEIFIAGDQLGNARTAVDVTIHELAHHTSQAEDTEPKHYEEISRLAGQIVSYVAGRNFDQQLQDPNFVW